MKSSFAEIDGERIHFLAKKCVYSSDATVNEEKEEHAKQDDYVLRHLFKKSGKLLFYVVATWFRAWIIIKASFYVYLP